MSRKRQVGLVALRTWLALRSQKRRRQRGGGELVFPVITLTLVELRVADQGSWTPVLDVSIQGELPEGFVVKLWQALDGSGDYACRGAVSASGLFEDYFGLATGHTATYLARASNTDDSVVGPWSEELFIDSQ